MPRLPDKTALGGPGALARTPMASVGNLATSAPIPLSVAQTGAGSIASGVGALAGTVGKLAEEDLATDLTKADAFHQKSLIETRRKFETDPDYATFPQRFGDEASAATDEAASMIRSPRLREKWLDGKATLEVARARDQVMRRADELGRQDKRDELDSALLDRSTAYGLAKTDEERFAIQRAAKDDIQLASQTGLLRPQDARRLWDKHIQGMEANDSLARTNRSYLPEGVQDGFQNLRDLTGKSDKPPEPSAGAASERGLDFIRRKEGFAPNAVWDTRQYSAGYGNKVAPGQTLTRTQAEALLKEDTGKVDKWIADNVSVSLTQHQHDALVSFGYNLGTGALDKLKDDINAGDIAKVSERMKTFNKALDQETGQLRERSGLTLRRMEEAEMFLNEGPSPRYSGLDYHKRQVLIKHQRDALTSVVQDDAKQAIEDLGKGLAPAVDAQGRTAFDRIRMVATPNQAHKIDIAANEALIRGRALYGDGNRLAPLSDLNEQEGTERVNAIQRERPQRNANAVWQKMLELRRKDPAQAVSGASVAGPGAVRLGVNDNGEIALQESAGEDYKFGPAKELQSAYKIVKARNPNVAFNLVQDEDGSLSAQMQGDKAAVQKAWTTLIEARLSAQNRLQIAPYDAKVLTKREAKELLGMPDRTAMRDEDVPKYLQAAANRAYQVYGPQYAERAFRDAVALQGSALHLTKDDRDAADSRARIISGMLWKATRGAGQTDWKKDIEKLDALSQIDRASELFDVSAGRSEPSTFRSYEDEMTSQARPGMPFARADLVKTPFAGAKAPRVYPEPTPAEVDVLRASPQHWQVFDQEYGPGAAARALAKQDTAAKKKK